MMKNHSRRLLFYIAAAFLPTLIVGCGRSSGSGESAPTPPSVVVPSQTEPPIVDADSVSYLGPMPEIQDSEIHGACVQIFYDRTNLAGVELGKIYAIQIANLIGHFPDLVRVISPIELYRAGDLDRCQANLYIGSYYGNRIPRAFQKEFETTSSRVAWLGYNHWTLGDSLVSQFGVQFSSLVSYDETRLDTSGVPGFFKYVNYKGERFSKIGTWKAASHSFTGSAEISKFEVVDSSKAQVLATITHSSSGEQIPWAIQAGKKFLFAEVPLSYMHEADRYLVFADLLFDIVGKQPLHNGKYAAIRLEDIHPFIDRDLLTMAVNTLRSQSVKPNLSLIPIFRDPLGAFPRDDMSVITRPMTEAPEFLALIHGIRDQGATFIWHGITHQTEDRENPFSGVSGDDYEFWDAASQGPIAEDSADYVREKFEWGARILAQAGLTPQIWMSPHYAASSLDNIMFGQLFNWTIGRQVYGDYEAYGWKLNQRPDELRFPNFSEQAILNRQNHFADLVVVQDSRLTAGQFFPYEISQDVYGQKVMPENLGNVQPSLNEQVTATRTVQQMLADAKRNLVLRDVWASAFYHPFLLAGQSLGQNDLRDLVVGLKNLGYRFIDLDEFARQRPEQRALNYVDLEQLRR